MRFKVYLAGPISNCSYNECTDWRDEVNDNLPPEIVGMSPMRGKTYLEAVEKIAVHTEKENELNTNSKVYHLRKILSSSRGIITRDYNDCTTADALIVYLLGATKVSIGTMMEIAWAYAMRIPVIAIMEPDNIHDHPMVNECIGYRCTSIADAVDLVTMLLLPCSHKDN